MGAEAEVVRAGTRLFILRGVFDIEVPNLPRGVRALSEEHQLYDVFLKLSFTD